MQAASPHFSLIQRGLSHAVSQHRPSIQTTSTIIPRFVKPGASWDVEADVDAKFILLRPQFLTLVSPENGLAINHSDHMLLMRCLTRRGKIGTSDNNHRWPLAPGHLSSIGGTSVDEVLHPADAYTGVWSLQTLTREEQASGFNWFVSSIHKAATPHHPTYHATNAIPVGSNTISLFASHTENVRSRQ